MVLFVKKLITLHLAIKPYSSFLLLLMRHAPPVIALYRSLRRQAQQFKDENFREYFTRIVKDDFRKAPHSEEFLKKQRENLEILKRQTVIEGFYFREEFDVRR